MAIELNESLALASHAFSFVFVEKKGSTLYIFRAWATL